MTTGADLDQALAEEAAVIATRAVPGFVPAAARPYGRVRRRSAAYQVTDGAGVSLAVKRERDGAAAVEQHVYRVVLPAAGLAAVHCHGVGPSREPGWSWLVTDHVEGAAFDPRDAAHTAGLGSWLGALHARTSGLPELAAVPRHGAAHWRALLEGAAGVLDGAIANPAVGAGAMAAITTLRAAFGAVVEGWAEIGALLDRAPASLVHGDLSHRNVKVVGPAGDLRPMVLDWETAGHGPAAVDLVWADLAAYEDAVAPAGPHLDGSSLRRLQTLGTLAWTAYVLHGERANLASPWPHRAAGKVASYLDLVDDDGVADLLRARVEP